MKTAVVVGVGPVRWLGGCLLMLILVACISVPFDYPREESYRGARVETGSLAALSDLWLSNNAHNTAVYPLGGGADAYAVRLDLIERAQATIDAQYFLIKPDAAGIGFTGALLRAAYRGVRVRLLLDDIFTTAKDEGLALLNAHDNVQVRLFNPLSRQGFTSLNYLADFKRANRRMHNKSFTVDGQITIIGGRNIAGEYFEMNPAVDFWDFEILSFGGLIGEVGDSFDDFWNHELSLPMQAFDSETNPKELESVRTELAEWRRTHPGNQLSTADGIIAGLLDKRLQPYFAEAHVISDHPDKLVNPVSREFQLLASSLGSLILAAETEIVVFSPYFIPNQGLADLFVAKQQEGVKVDILTNSLASTNHVAVHSGYKRYRKTLLQGGVGLWEVSAHAANPGTDITTTLHTKAIMFDRRWLFVGSLNVDPRSIDINTEMGLILDSPELTRDLHAAAADTVRKYAYKVELTPDGSLKWLALRDGKEISFNKEPESSWWRRFSAGLYGLLPIEGQL
ncbi:MAG: phospholipase D family protein [Gammaproteobacteria bacterium]|nr:phospholipase D family protein [Gammaproteobacteria bacterium]